jgi:glutathione synthase
MKILFVADPLESFNIKKDTTYVMMRQAQRRGHEVYACEVGQLSRTSGSLVSAHVWEIELALGVEQGLNDARLNPLPQGPHAPWYRVTTHAKRKLTEFDAIVMRKDPPFDVEYFYATHLLGLAAREGAKVFNNPQALRDHPEKLSILDYPQFTPATLVTRSAHDIREFHRLHQDIILKPLDGMGGRGIYRVKEDGLNLGSLIETLNGDGAQTVMVQKFIPAIELGDKRILIIAGQAVPFALARIPQGGEVRGNLAAGGKGVARPLSARDWEIAQCLGPILWAKGLLLVGLDVIGDHLTEINVTSPTCFQEITDQTGCDVSELFLQALELAASDASSVGQ